MRKILDEADGVTDQDSWTGFGHEHTYGGVEGREELIGDVHRIVCQTAHEPGFSRVRVTDQGDGLRLVGAAAAALRLGLSLHADQRASKLGDSIPHSAASEFERGFASPLAADPAALTLDGGVRFPKSRRRVDEPRDLNLDLRFARSSVTLKDGKDHHRPIEDLDAGHLLEVAHLRRRQVVVDNDGDGLWCRLLLCVFLVFFDRVQFRRRGVGLELGARAGRDKRRDEAWASRVPGEFA